MQILSLRKFFFILPALVLLLFFSLPQSPSYSITKVFGPQGGQTWTLSNSPYRVTGEVYVAQGTILTIEAGVTVEFEARSFGQLQIRVDGTLTAVGTPEQYITFTSSKETGKLQTDWYRIWLFGPSADRSVLKYCIVESSMQGVLIHNSSAAVYNSILRNNQISVYAYKDSYIYDPFPKIENNVFTGATVEAIYVYWSRPLIKNNYIANNQMGILAAYTSFPFIFGNSIVNNTKYGVQSQTSSPTIVFNNFSGNGFGVSSEIGVDASRNWWGSTNGPTVPGGPARGDSIGAHVVYENWLNDPVLYSPPSSVSALSLKSDRTYFSPFSGNLGVPNQIFIQVSGADTSSETYNWATVVITNESFFLESQRTLPLDLMETEKNSGLYCGVAWTSGYDANTNPSPTDQRRFFVAATTDNEKIRISSLVPSAPSLLVYTGYENHWVAANNPIRLAGGASYVVPAGSLTTIHAGVTVEGFPQSMISHSEYQPVMRLVGSGEAGNRIIFTAADPTPEAGGNNWAGVHLVYSDELRYCDIKYGYTENVFYWRGAGLMENCNILYGLNGVGGGINYFKIAKCNIKFNKNNGVYFGGYDTSPFIRYCNISGNGWGGVAGNNFGALNQNPLGSANYHNASLGVAAENWWGDASGPSGSGEGSGDRISGRVVYKPWITSEISPEPKSTLSQLGLYLDKDCAIPATKIGVLDNLYVRVTASNYPTNMVNIARVKVTRSGSGGDEIILDLLETSADSGVYVGALRVMSTLSFPLVQRTLGNIPAAAGDTLTASSLDSLDGTSPVAIPVTNQAFWRAANNPNRLTGVDVTLCLPPSYYLSIEAGVTFEAVQDNVAAGGGAILTVYGTLEALGSPSKRIVFTSIASDPLAGDYRGPAFGLTTSNRSVIKYCDLKYSRQLTIVNAAPLIEHNRITKGLDYGIYLDGANGITVPRIKDNEIDHINFNNFSVLNNPGGIYCYRTCAPVIEYNYIHDNASGISVRAASPVIRLNSIEANNPSNASDKGGLIFIAAGAAATPEVINNNILNNKNNILVYNDWSSQYGPRFRYNNVYNSPPPSGAGIKGLFVTPPVGLPTVEAVSNFWGGSLGPYHIDVANPGSIFDNPEGNTYSQVSDLVSFVPYLTMEAQRSNPSPTGEYPANGGATNVLKPQISVKIASPYGIDLSINPPVLSVNGISHVYPDGGRLTFVSTLERLVYSTTEAYLEGTQEVSLVSAESILGVGLEQPYTWSFISDYTSPEMVDILASPSVASLGIVVATVEAADSLSGIENSRSPSVILRYPGGSATFTQVSYAGGVWTGTAEVLSSFTNGFATIEADGVFDRAGNKAAASVESNELFIDLVSPEAILYQPNGGELLSWALTYTITWDAYDPPPTQGLADNPISLYLLTGEGLAPILITSDAPNTGSYDWVVPTVISSRCAVLIDASDKAGNIGSDSSDGYFSISPVNPYVVSTYPTNEQANIPVNTPYMRIVFSKPMNADSIRPALVISPDAPGALIEFSRQFDQDIYIFNFSAPLQFFTTYEVMITGEAQDQFGNPLLNPPYTFEFTTRLPDFTPPTIGPVLFNGRTYAPPPPDNIMLRSPAISARITDEAGGSGVDPSSIVILVDGFTYRPPDYLYDRVTGWLTYTITDEIPIGQYVVTIEAADYNDNTMTWEGQTRVKLGPVIDHVRFDGRVYVRGDIISSNPRVEARILDAGTTETVDIASIKINAGPHQIYPGASSYNTGVGIMNYDMRRETASLGPGTYTFTIEARDVYGNIGLWEGYDLRVMSGKTKIVGPIVSHPTPFKPLSGERVTIAYNLSLNADITIYFYDTSGRTILTKKFSGGLAGGKAGYNDFSWDGITDFGRVVGNGIYVYRIISDKKVIGTGKLVVLE